MTSARAAREPAKAVSVLVTSTRHVLPCSTVHVPAGRATVTSVGTPGVTRCPHRCDQRPRLADGAALDLPGETKGHLGRDRRDRRGDVAWPTMVIRWTSRVHVGPTAGRTASCRSAVRPAAANPGMLVVDAGWPPGG